MITHELKCWPEYFQEILAGTKWFELRKNDRDFDLEDILLLREWDPITKEYSGREQNMKVTYILRDTDTDYVIRKGYCVLSISLPSDSDGCKCIWCGAEVDYNMSDFELPDNVTLPLCDTCAWKFIELNKGGL